MKRTIATLAVAAALFAGTALPAQAATTSPQTATQFGLHARGCNPTWRDRLRHINGLPYRFCHPRHQRPTLRPGQPIGPSLRDRQPGLVPLPPVLR